MRPHKTQLGTPGRSCRRLLGAVAVALTVGLVSAGPASAALEQVGTFGGSGEAQQLAASQAVAVNATGAGGVPPGTVYVASQLNRVVRYGPHGEFLAAWGWDVSATNQTGGYERCGPDGELPEHPTCNVNGSSGGEGAGQLTEPLAIAVDQATGDVYVLGSRSAQRKHGLIQVFSPDGAEILSSFGDLGEFTSPFDETPELLHDPRVGGLAVSDAGVVSIVDRKDATPEKPGNDFRIMTFTPTTPGSAAAFTYSGRSTDIDTGEHAIAGLATDDAGNFYVAGENTVWELSPGHGAQPICLLNVPGGGVGSLTVAPESGELFVFNSKDKLIHLFSPCVSGAFSESGNILVTPTPENLSTVSLAVAPGEEWDATRPAGVLYAVDGTPNASRHGLGHIYAHPAALAPVVESESFSSATSSTITLNALISARGATTSFEFQYIDAATYESNPPTERFNGAGEAPFGGGTLPSGAVGAAASVSLSGLDPDTEYHFRIVARSHCETEAPEAICEGVGKDEAFRTFPASSGQLADGRAYELVSPVEKRGGEPFPLTPGLSSCEVECKPGVGATPYPRVVATDGESIAYQGFPFSQTKGASNYNGYVSQRTGVGWETLFASPPLMGAQSNGYRAFSPDLKSAVIIQDSEVPTLSSLAPEGYANLYLQSPAIPTTLSPLLVDPPPNRPSSSSTAFALRFAGASADLSRIFFEANDALTEASASAPAAVDGGAGKYNLYEWSAGALRLVNVAPGNTSTAPGAEIGSSIVLSGHSDKTTVNTNAVSRDGLRVFWSSEAGQVFVRIDGETTEEVPDPGRFRAAAADGSAVLLNDGHLYDLETGVLTDLTEGHGAFEGFMGQSEDLSRIYFVDAAVLTPGEPNGEGAEAQLGKPNLYLWQEGHATFVATVLPRDNEPEGDWIAAPSARTAQASPDGNWLSFLSSKSFTGYDNVGSCSAKDPKVIEPCAEAYLFDAATGKLVCASCKPTGQPPIGTPATLPTIGEGGAIELPQYLDNAGRLFFNSQDALALGDTDGRVEDVYEYEPDGTGSCGRAEGCISLISAGTGASDSDFLGVDESGKNVFFTTRDRLVPQDHDELLDVYDAREGGGFAAESESAPKACSGETCQISQPLQLEATPGSLSFFGAGNLFAAAPVSGVAKSQTKPLTRAQKLARALKACKKKPKKKRSACEKTARKRYGAKGKQATGERKGGRS